MKEHTMGRIMLLAIIAAALGRGASAQSTPAPPTTVPQADGATADSANPQDSKPFPSGTIIAIELSKALDAKKAKVGDTVDAKIPADVLLHGKIVIPRSARIVGHVTEVKAHSKESPDARVGVAFDRLVTKNGDELHLHLVVQAISRPLQQVYASDSHLDNGGISGTASTGGIVGSMPPRATERVANIPLDPGSDTPPPTTVAPLGPTSKGVVGMKGLVLKGSEQGSVISSEKDNVRLDSGAQMILRVE